jgi:hypothetical protein
VLGVEYEIINANTMTNDDNLYGVQRAVSVSVSVSLSFGRRARGFVRHAIYLISPVAEDVLNCRGQEA